MLEAIDVVKSFGERAVLRGLNLAVGPGEVYCLLGPNGAGKTTTLSLFLDFLEPTSGRVLVDGLDVAAHPREARDRLGFVPERVSLYGELSGLGNVEYFVGLNRGVGPGRDEICRLLREVGLPEACWSRRASTYSKGMRQKVAIAIALAKRARALLLDEPTSGLDPSATRDFADLVSALRDDGVAILMTTHDLARSHDFATRLGIMRGGRIVRELAPGDGSIADLYEIYLQVLDPSHDES